MGESAFPVCFTFLNLTNFLLLLDTRTFYRVYTGMYKIIPVHFKKQFTKEMKKRKKNKAMQSFPAYIEDRKKTSFINEMK